MITSKDTPIIEEVVESVLEDWSEVYVLDGPTYAIYSKLLMGSIGSKMDIDHWSMRNKGVDFFKGEFTLNKFFDKDPDELEADLESSQKLSVFLRNLREDIFCDFTLISPFLPESLMLNFYNKLTKDLYLYYKLEDSLQRVNLLSEFSDECDELGSLYMAGCLSCSNSHNCVPLLTDNQVDYGFRLNQAKIKKAAKKIASSTALTYAPMAAHRVIMDNSFRLLRRSSPASFGAFRSTEQLLLSVQGSKSSGGYVGTNYVNKGIRIYLDYQSRRAEVKKFKEEECSKCILRPSCESLQLNKAYLHSYTNVSKNCKGATTKETSGLESTLIRIAAKLFILDATENISPNRFTCNVYQEFSQVELTPKVKEAMGIIKANDRFFYGAIILPTSMTTFVEYEMSSELCSSVMNSWGRESKAKFISNMSSRVHTGIAGLERFSNTETSEWSILLPTHDYRASCGKREFSSSETAWYVSITAEEFITTFGDMPRSRVYANTWLNDWSIRVLYLMKAFVDITKPRYYGAKGSFGVCKYLLPGYNHTVHMPTNTSLKELAKSTTTVDLLTDYINDFVEKVSTVSWPRSVVLDAFSIDIHTQME